MFIHYPNYTHRIRTLSTGIIFEGAYIRKDILVSFQVAYLWKVYIAGGGLFSRFYVITLRRGFMSLLLSSLLSCNKLDVLLRKISLTKRKMSTSGTIYTIFVRLHLWKVTWHSFVLVRSMKLLLIDMHLDLMGYVEHYRQVTMPFIISPWIIKILFWEKCEVHLEKSISTTTLPTLFNKNIQWSVFKGRFWWFWTKSQF